MFKRYVASKRHTMQVDFDDYVLAARQERRRGERARRARRAPAADRAGGPGVTSVAAGRRERTKAANRAALLEAARDVFGELGFEAAGVRDIVRRTDLASGTFYNYFDGQGVDLPRRRRGDRRGGAAARARRAGGGARIRGVRRGRLPRVLRVHRRGPGDVRVHAPQPRRARRRRRRGRAAARRGGAGGGPGGAAARGELPALDLDYCAHAMVAVGVELGARMAEREPPDVEGATRFATGLFLAGVTRP